MRIPFQGRRPDEYDAAQARGEVAKNGGNRGNQFASILDQNTGKVTDLGLTSQFLKTSFTFPNGKSISR
jgi:hypothetical protein